MTWMFEKDNVHNFSIMNDIFNSNECEDIIVNNNLTDKEDAVINTGITNHNIRFNKALSLDQYKYDWLYKRIEDAVCYLNDRCFGFDIYGFSDPIQFLEYNSPGNKYTSHIDKSFQHKVRKLTAVIQLTDDHLYDGGNLMLHFDKDPVKMDRRKGSIIVFPSYVLHEVTPMISGTRHSLVAWIAGPNFK